MWLNQSVNYLIERGHRLSDIGDYTLDQFVMFLDAAEQNRAAERENFVTDLGVVVGSLFSKDNPIREHMDVLKAIRKGESHDGSGKQS